MIWLLNSSQAPHCSAISCHALIVKISWKIFICQVAHSMFPVGVDELYNASLATANILRSNLRWTGFIFIVPSMFQTMCSLTPVLAFCKRVVVMLNKLMDIRQLPCYVSKSSDRHGGIEGFIPVSFCPDVKTKASHWLLTVVTGTSSLTPLPNCKVYASLYAMRGLAMK